jgi:hypothetical protein
VSRRQIAGGVRRVLPLPRDCIPPPRRRRRDEEELDEALPQATPKCAGRPARPGQFGQEAEAATRRGARARIFGPTKARRNLQPKETAAPAGQARG